MNPTIQVTINPDGTAKEVNFRGDKPINPENYRGSTFYLAYVQMQKDWHIAERALRTFEIEFVCICDFTNMSGCNIICNPHDLDTSKVYTAEILPNNKVKILS